VNITSMVKSTASTKKLASRLGESSLDAVDDEVIDFLCCVLADGTSLEHEIIDIAWRFIQELDPALDEQTSRNVAKELRLELNPKAATASLTSYEDEINPTRLAAPKRLGGSALQRRLKQEEEDVNGNLQAKRKKDAAAGNANATLDRSIEAQEAKELAKFRKARRTGKDTSKIVENLATVSAIRTKVAAGQVDVRAEGIDISFGGHTLLEHAAINFAYGRRYGIVGRNGIGKSTLMKAIARRELPLPDDMDVLFVEQEAVGDNQTPLQLVLNADSERKRLLDAEKRINQELADETNNLSTEERMSLENELKRVYQDLEMTSADQAVARAGAILAGFGFDDDMQKRPSSSFSGGWRMRIAIAQALFVQPKLLLLDEPTNHLDLNSVLFLSDLLQQWPHTIVTVSHDRDFLNDVCTDIVYIKDKQLHPYAGNYDDFEKARADQLKEMMRASETFEMRRKHIQSFVDRFRYNAKRAAMAQSRIKLLQKMEENRVVLPSEEAEFAFDFPEPGVLTGSHASIVLAGVSFGWQNVVHQPATADGQAAGPPTVTQKMLFENLDFSINMDSRAALVGPNGAGKSTLLKLLLGEIHPVKGDMRKSPKLRIGYFSQHHVDQLALWRTPVEHMKVLFAQAAIPELRSHLGKLGVSQEMQMRPINTLSGGQKSRVALAAITYTNPHVLLLDEITNHLDIESIDAICSALNRFAGGILVVSHDSRLLSMVCDEIYIVDKGTVTQYPEDFRSYRAMMLKNLRKSSVQLFLK